MAKRKRKKKNQSPLQQQQQQHQKEHQRIKNKKKNQNEIKKNNMQQQHQEEKQLDNNQHHHHQQKKILEEQQQQTNDHQQKKRRKKRHEPNKNDKDTKNKTTATTTTTTTLSLATKLRRHRGTAESTPLPPEWSGCTRYHSEKTKKNNSDSSNTNNNRRRLGNKTFLTPDGDDYCDGGGNISTTASDFQSCLTECYHGFHWDNPSSLSNTLHNAFSHAFHNLDTAQFFLHDAVQPGGKKVSRTYVTRTLVGHPGTTYRYLGLRLFSHPWCDVDENGDAAAAAAVVVDDDNDQKQRRRRRGQSLRELGYTPTAINGLLSFGDVNRELISRTEQLLTDKISPYVRPEGLVGSALYNISLVNRMEPTTTTSITTRHDLKEESLFGMGKTSVSWHSDSGLQDFSSIAVYHQLIASSSVSQQQQQRRKPQQQQRPWRIALRVSSETTKTPALCVPLPHGALYYLLDDFNHKHEHAVLTGEDDSLRYSSTHRVAKEACGTWQYIRDKCETTLSSKAMTTTTTGKDITAQQQLLTEIEFEWLRQWYIQGGLHAELHFYWHEPVKRLEGYVQTLETMTLSVLNSLKQLSSSSTTATASSAAATAATTTTTMMIITPSEHIFDIMINAFEERMNLRRQWITRRKDPIYNSLPTAEQPLPCHVWDDYETRGNRGGEQKQQQQQQLLGLPQDLTPLIKQLRGWRRDYVTITTRRRQQHSAADNNNSVIKNVAKKSSSSSSDCRSTKWSHLTTKEQKMVSSNWEQMKSTMSQKQTSSSSKKTKKKKRRVLSSL